ncbi:MAG TPA: cupin domain-containing protein [Clostridia bacterium]|jgi:mannose-6-phosphate isomerase-like protein (cupin superfamily)|nr:cupin domain-containing protein [Clostridia bacterium]
MNPMWKMFSCPYLENLRMASSVSPQQHHYQHHQQQHHQQNYSHNFGHIHLKDYGPEPFVVNINQAAKQNDYFRIALWTGNHLQITLMSINVGEDIGLEMHPDLDQFIRIEQGQGLVRMGERQDRLNFERRVYDDYAFVIPAGTWHNLINTGNVPIKLYSIYAPPQHPRETIHKTKADAED